MSEQEENVAFAELRASENNKMSINVVAGYIYTKAKKVFQESFTEIYEDLLSRIAYDYKINLNELRERYPLEVNVSKRKPIDPANCCLAQKTKGGQCTFPRKPGRDYCGIHQKKLDSGGVVPTVEQPMEINFNRSGGTYRPKREEEATPARVYKPKKDQAEADLPSESSETDLTVSVDHIDENGQVDIEIEKIDGKDFIVCGQNIYFYPEDCDLSSMGLEDLTKAGHWKNEEIIWLD